MFQSRKAVSAPSSVDETDRAAISSEGDINSYPSNTYTLGNSTFKWKELNGMDISGLGVQLIDSITGTSGTNTVTTKTSYVKLPGGAICQWGSISDSSNPKTVSFPVQFPNSVSSVTCATVRSSNGSGGYNHVYDVDINGCSLILDGSNGFWMAWGH